MSKKIEEAKIDRAKHDNDLAKLLPIVTKELDAICTKHDVMLRARLNPYGPPTPDLTSKKPANPPAKKGFMGIGGGTIIDTTKSDIMNADKEIHELLNKHGLMMFAVIGMMGAELKIDLMKYNDTKVVLPPQQDIKQEVADVSTKL